MAREDELYHAGLAHTEALEGMGIDPFPAEPFRRTHLAAELIQHFDTIQGQAVRVAGRMTSKRDHGNLIFASLEDQSGGIQTMNRRSDLGLPFQPFKEHFVAGDFVGTTGTLIKTRTGEVTVLATENTMLAKALRPAPLAFRDPEDQQRQRYLHTLVDKDARNRFRLRSRLVRHMRDYFTDKLGCLEVETPIMDTTYGGASAKPFTTYHNALGEQLYLRISNELHLKRMTVGGFYEGVFEFSRDFRNEGMDRIHNPEFTQVELYKPFWDYYDMMDMAEELLESAALKLTGSTSFPFGEYRIDCRRPWRRLRIYDGVEEKYDMNPGRASLNQLLAKAVAHDVLKEVEAFKWSSEGIYEGTKGDLVMDMFEHAWESELINPTFIYDYPADTSALTKRHRSDPELTERFEVVVGGFETMNCYTELNDPRDQRQRFETEKSRRERGDEEAMPFDGDFILAQEYGMPQQAGIGISIDRWTMLLSNTDHIRQVIWSPTLKPRG